MRGKLLLSLALLALPVGGAWAQDMTFEITVTAGKHDYKNVPVVVPLSVSKDLAEQTHSHLLGDGKQPLIGQLTAPGLTMEHLKPSDRGLVRRDLHFIVPELKAGEQRKWRLTLFDGKQLKPESLLLWRDTPGLFAELLDRHPMNREDRPLVRYMYKALDESSKDARDLTYKVFHHLYDPAGTRFVTNGGPKGLYPHHRGMYFAFNKVSYDGGKKQADVWHCTKDAYQSHQGFVSKEEGAILGRHRVLVGWHGPKKEMFAREEREITVYRVPGGTLVEFASRLKTLVGPVRLDGDPQHSGFHFRAANEVSDKVTSKLTYYVRPDGKGKLGETRNWDPKTKKGPVDLPWDALCFMLDSKRYTVEYMNSPSNPRESRFSERDYGRFGCYFEYDLTTERPLQLDYRIWLQNGEMTVPEAVQHYTNFATPPSVTVK